MKIINSEIKDIDLIFDMYKEATDYQKERVIYHWPNFDRQMVKKELIEKRQFKLIIDNTVACVWAIAFDDPLIWGKMNNSESIYIHRIAVHKDYRGNNFALKIVTWAKEFARKNQKFYIRLDTVGLNEKLISHYTKCGFKFLGLTQLGDVKGLPDHYINAKVSLFEIKL